MSVVLDFSSRRRIPVVLQSEAAECGLACLAMILNHHGHVTDLPSLRQRFSFSMKGTTLAHLMQIAGELKLLPRPVKLQLSQLDKLTLPAVLHWDFNHFVVLTKVNSKTIVVHDPASGERIVPLEEASKHFTGVALEITPSTEFKPVVQRRKINLRQLLGRLPGVGKALTQIFLLAAVLEVFVIASPFYMQLVVDSAVVSEDRDLLTVLGIGFLLLVVLQVGVTLLRSWVLMVLGTTLNLKLMSNLFRHLLSLPMSFFGKRHLGDVISRFDSLSAIQRTLTTTFIEAVLDSIMALTTLLMMSFYSLKLTAVVITAAVLYGLIKFVLYRPLRHASEQEIHFGAKQQSSFIETVRAVQSVKLFNREDHRLALYQNRMVETFNASIRMQKLQILSTALNRTLFGVENIAVVWLGALLILDHVFSVGMLFAFMAYKQQFTSRVSGFIEKAIEFKMLELHMDRVGDIALTDPEPEGDGNPATAQIGHYALDVRQLDYQYSDAEPAILRNVNLHIDKGESVAIIGPSGCGKTTLLKLMLGLLQPTAGEVLVGGVNLNRLPPQRYREWLGAVMQDDQLLAGSIADNISFFDPEPDQAWIEQCAAIAAIHEEIRAMPMGYNTLIGDMGTVLSGGQKQRIQLARALYKRPKILFLDEATSHLDVARERMVNNAIQQLKITRVFIAHRAETIASADRIILLGQQGTESILPQQFLAKSA